MLAKSPVGKGWTGALSGEFLPDPDQLATVDLRTDDSRQHASPVERDDLDLPVFMISGTARQNFLAGNVAQSGDVEPVRASGCLHAVCGALWLSRHGRGFENPDGARLLLAQHDLSRIGAVDFVGLEIAQGGAQDRRADVTTAWRAHPI